jgi:hypothetical protein
MTDVHPHQLFQPALVPRLYQPKHLDVFTGRARKLAGLGQRP